MDDAGVGRARGSRTPRQVAGDRAEEAVARHLAAAGWTILARNVRVGRSEVDILALDPMATLVVVEVRSRSGPGFGAPEESVDSAKVGRLYASAWQLAKGGHLPDGRRLPERPFRVDLVTVLRAQATDEWTVTQHLRGLAPY
jgi:putative endonuclease